LNKTEELEKLIKVNLEALIDSPLDMDNEEKWHDFEKRLATHQKESNGNRFWLSNYQRKFGFVAAFAAVFLIILFCSPKTVIGFKNELFTWLGRTSDGDLVISEKYNPKYKEGIFKEISMEEAKGLVVFELKYPQYIPEVFQSPPEISVTSKNEPKSVVSIGFFEGDMLLISKQENVLLLEAVDTYVPENAIVQNIKIRNDLDAVIITLDNSIQVIWTENLIRFTIISRNIKEEEIIKVIEALK